jgi:hypothetical protein
VALGSTSLRATDTKLDVVCLVTQLAAMLGKVLHLGRGAVTA